MLEGLTDGERREDWSLPFAAAVVLSLLSCFSILCYQKQRTDVSKRRAASATSKHIISRVPTIVCMHVHWNHKKINVLCLCTFLFVQLQTEKKNNSNACTVIILLVELL